MIFLLHKLKESPNLAASDAEGFKDGSHLSFLLNHFVYPDFCERMCLEKDGIHIGMPLRLDYI